MSHSRGISPPRSRLHGPLWPNGAPGSEARKGEAEIATPGNLINVHNPSSSLSAVKGEGDRCGRSSSVRAEAIGISRSITKVTTWANGFSDYGIAGFCAQSTASHAKPTEPTKSKPTPWRMPACHQNWSESGERNGKFNPSAVGIIGFSAGGEIAANGRDAARRESWKYHDEVESTKIPARFSGAFLSGHSQGDEG